MALRQLAFPRPIKTTIGTRFDKPMTAMRKRMRIFPVNGALALTLLMVAPLCAQRPERPALAITGYVIDAELDPATHHLAAKAVVTFTAPETAEAVSFGFHPALKVTKITDESGKLLTGERTADGTIRVTPAAPFAKGQPSHWTFEYEGMITGNEDGPVEGLKLAAIQEPITYLLYPARWFPMTGYLTDRFTAEMHIRVPQGMRVFASGSQGPSQPGHPGQRQARRPVRLQLDQARLSRNGDCRALRGAGFGGRRQREGLPDHQPPAVGQRPGADGGQGVRLLYRQLWRAGDQPSERGGAARRHPARRLGAGAGGDHGLARGRQERRAPAGQHHRPPVVGFRGQPAHPQRRLDHQRHGPLRRADVCGGRERQERHARGPSGRGRRRAGLRHHSPLQRRPPQPLLARVPVHDPGKGRHGLPHAALGDRRQGLSGHAQGRAEPVHRQPASAPRTSRRWPRRRASSS